MYIEYLSFISKTLVSRAQKPMPYTKNSKMLLSQNSLEISLNVVVVNHVTTI